jgi:hypothetical protein
MSEHKPEYSRKGRRGYIFPLMAFAITTSVAYFQGAFTEVKELITTYPYVLHIVLGVSLTVYAIFRFN